MIVYMPMNGLVLEIWHSSIASNASNNNKKAVTPTSILGVTARVRQMTCKISVTGSFTTDENSSLQTQNKHETLIGFHS